MGKSGRNKKKGGAGGGERIVSDEVFNKVKEEGNRMFAENDYVGAMRVYEKALEIFPEKHPDRTELHYKFAACHNRAPEPSLEMTIYHCSKAMEMTIYHCSKAIELQPDYFQARLLRASQYTSMSMVENLYVMVMEDVESVMNVEPDQVDALDILQRLNKMVEDFRSRRSSPYVPKKPVADDHATVQKNLDIDAVEQFKLAEASEAESSAVEVNEKKLIGMSKSKQTIMSGVEISGKQLCVICESTYQGSSDCYNIFMVDLNNDVASESFVKREPDVRLRDIQSCLTFCNFGLDIYIFNVFGDCHPVYKFKLEDALKSKIVVGYSTMETVSNIPNPIYCSAKAIPTPDNRIVLLSSMARFYGADGVLHFRRDNKIINGPQLFDPKTLSWSQLPPLCIRRSTSSNFEVLDASGCWTKFAVADGLSGYGNPHGLKYDVIPYCFISESTLLVHIVSKVFGPSKRYKQFEGHFLTLNIGQGWKPWDDCEFYKTDPHLFKVDEMLVVENRLFLNGSGGTDLSASPMNFNFPRSVFLHMRPEIVLTEYVEGKECCFAIVSVDPFIGPRLSHLVVDEFKYDLTQVGICTPKIKTPFKFNIRRSTIFFYVSHLFMLSPPPFPFKIPVMKHMDN